MLLRSFRDWVGLKERLSLVWWRKQLSKEIEELQAEAVVGAKALRWEGALSITVPTTNLEMISMSFSRCLLD